MALTPVLSVPVRSELLNFILTHNQTVWVYGNSVFGDINKEMWRYDENSTASVSSTVIKPNDIPSGTPGRYIFLYSDSNPKKRETLTATTNGSGVATFTFANTYSVVPNIQYVMGAGANIKDTIIFNATPTVTGCSLLVQVRNDVLGLLPTYSNVTGREVNILVTEK